MQLASSTMTNLNITAEATVLSYTYTGDPVEVMARADLGDNTRPIVGNGIYVLNVYINNVVISPSSEIVVASGVTKTVMVSRAIPIKSGDTIAIKVKGLGGDTQVNTSTTLRDVTPAKLDDLVGDGAIVVDHNYGSADALSYRTSGGVGVVGAEVRAYLQSDYDAGNRGAAYVVGRTTTTTAGRWLRALMLPPGNYTLLYYLTGYYGPDTANVTVT